MSRSWPEGRKEIIHQDCFDFSLETYLMSEAHMFPRFEFIAERETLKTGLSVQVYSGL